MATHITRGGSVVGGWMVVVGNSITLCIVSFHVTIVCVGQNMVKQSFVTTTRNTIYSMPVIGFNFPAIQRQQQQQQRWGD